MSNEVRIASVNWCPTVRNDEAMSETTITWKNPDLIQGLNTIFAVKPHEEIVGITVTEKGLTAHFKRK